MNRNRVFFILPSLGSGGAERVVSLISKSLAERGYEVSILVFNNVPHAFFVDRKVNVVTIGVPLGISGLVGKFRNLMALRTFIRQYSGAIFIPFQQTCLRYMSLASIGISLKIVACERNDPYHIYPTETERRRMKHLYGKASYCVFQTKRAADFYGVAVKNKSIIIPNPITKPVEIWKRELNKLKIISVCRLTKQKNIRMSLDAISKVIYEYKIPVTYDIFGDGELKQELIQYVHSHGLDNIVNFKGLTSEVVQELCSSSLYISSSDYEGISNSMLEALSVGMPVICTDCPIGGAFEMIDNDKNGILVPVGDHCALAEAIVKVFSDPEYAYRIADEARERCDKYNLNSTTDLWESVIINIGGMQVD